MRIKHLKINMISIQIGDTVIHLSPDCVRFFWKDVLEIPEENFELPDFFKILELKYNLIIWNLYIARDEMGKL